MSTNECTERKEGLLPSVTGAAKNFDGDVQIIPVILFLDDWK